MRGRETLKVHRGSERPSSQRPRMSEGEGINLMRQPVDTNVLAELEERRDRILNVNTSDTTRVPLACDVAIV